VITLVKHRFQPVDPKENLLIDVGSDNGRQALTITSPKDILDLLRFPILLRGLKVIQQQEVDTLEPRFQWNTTWEKMGFAAISQLCSHLRTSNGEASCSTSKSVT